MASVTYEHIYKRYGDITVVNDFHLQIYDKEFLVFVASRIATGVLDLAITAFLAEILKINDVIAKTVANIAVVIVNYLLMKFVVFRSKKISRQ